MSNIGAQRIMALRKSKFETMERLVRQEAQRELRPEIFARINAVVVFNKLDFDTQRVIARDMIEAECAAQAVRGCTVGHHDSVSEVVIQRDFNDRLGARPMRDATELLVRNAIAADLLAGGTGNGRLRPDAGGLRLELRAS